MTTITRQAGPDLLDLLAEVEPVAPVARRSRSHASDVQREAAAAARTAYAAAFERAPWTWQHDGVGVTAGDVELGWRCPDPRCGRVEPSTFLLSLNHGWNPDCPQSSKPLDGSCGRVTRLAAHRWYHENRCEPGCGCADADAAADARDEAVYWPSVGGRP